MIAPLSAWTREVAHCARRDARPGYVPQRVRGVVLASLALGEGHVTAAAVEIVAQREPRREEESE